MVRRRLPLNVIENGTSRKRTYRSRKNNLMKKAHELRTLCGVSTCVILYNPEDHDKTETYPPDREGVVEVIDKYVTAGNKKPPLGLSKFFKELKKGEEENRNAKYPLPPRDLIENILSREDLESLYKELSAKIAVAKNRLNMTDNLGRGPGTGMYMNLMESSPTGPIGKNLGSNYDVAWSTSKGNSFTNLIDQNYYNNNPPPFHQYPQGQDQYSNQTLMMSSLGYPNNIDNYTWTVPPLLQDPAAGPTLFCNNNPPPFQDQYSNQTLMMSSLGYPNNIDNYTWTVPPLLQDPAAGPTLFCNNPLPLAMQLSQGALIQYPVSTSFNYGPSEQSSSSSPHNNTLLHDYNYGGPSFFPRTEPPSSSSHTFHYGVSGSSGLPPSSTLPPLPTEQSSSSQTSFLDQLYRDRVKLD